MCTRTHTIHARCRRIAPGGCAIGTEGVETAACRGAKGCFRAPRCVRVLTTAHAFSPNRRGARDLRFRGCCSAAQRPLLRPPLVRAPLLYATGDGENALARWRVSDGEMEPRSAGNARSRSRQSCRRTRYVHGRSGCRESKVHRSARRRAVSGTLIVYACQQDACTTEKYAQSMSQVR